MADLEQASPLQAAFRGVLSRIREGLQQSRPAALTPEMITRLPNVRWLLLVLTLAMIIILVRFFPISAIAVSEPIGLLQILGR